MLQQVRLKDGETFIVNPSAVVLISQTQCMGEARVRVELANGSPFYFRGTLKGSQVISMGA